MVRFLIFYYLASEYTALFAGQSLSTAPGAGLVGNKTVSYCLLNKTLSSECFVELSQSRIS